jgi:NTE family protein
MAKQCWWLIWLTLIAAPVMGGEAADGAQTQQRPRIGLVLSGGGARGAAHVGVIKALEAMRIPIDVVAGASMGAVIGGLYASGLEAEELEALLNAIDWRAAFSDEVDRSHLSFRRRQDDREFLVKMDIGLRHGSLALPKGLLQGQNIGAILRGATFRVAGIGDFDALPTPFRAVATDLLSGEPYVFDSGSLSLAMRASMSVPGVFEPVPHDERLLVDGGVVANLPVDALKPFDCDVIIAVDVSEPLVGAAGLESAVDVSNQMISIFMRRQTAGVRANLSADDVFIQPDLTGFGSAEFLRVAEAIPAGEVATWAAEPALRELALSPAGYAAFQQSRVERLPTETAVRFATHLPAGADGKERQSDETWNLQDLENVVNDSFGTGLYALVDYELNGPVGETSADFRLLPKPWGPNYLRFGISLEDDFEGDSDFNLGLRYTRTALNEHGAEWRNDLRLGASPLLASELYLPFQSVAPFFVAPRVVVGQRDLKLFDLGGAGRRQFRVSEASLSLVAGKELGRAVEVRVGLERGVGRGWLKLGSPDPLLGERFSFQTGEIFAQLQIDTLDRVNFPAAGTLASLRWTGSRPGIGADESFEHVQLAWSQAKTFGSTTLLAGVDIATTLDSGAEVQDFFSLGGFLRLSGVEPGSLVGPHRGVARVIGYRRMKETGGGLFDLPWYVGMSLEAGNVWEDRRDARFDTLKLGGSLFTGLDTFIGPVYFALGFAEGGERAVYLFLGQTFRQTR